MTQQVPLHPDIANNIDAFAHLFTVDLSKHPIEAANIGKHCTFKEPKYPAYRGMFVIGSLQFDYQGILCYRVYSTDVDRNDTFGTPAGVDEIHILEQ